MLSKSVTLPLLALGLLLILSGCSENQEAADTDKDAMAAEQAIIEALAQVEEPELRSLGVLHPPPEIDLTGLSEEQQAALLARVEGKWKAMERRDYPAVYEYATPNYRKIFTLNMYLNKFGYDLRSELTGVEIVAYDAHAAVASVAVRVMSESAYQSALTPGLGALPTTINEKWILIDGEWWNNAK